MKMIPKGSTYHCPICNKLLATALVDINVGDRSNTVTVDAVWTAGQTIVCPDCGDKVPGFLRMTDWDHQRKEDAIQT
jgi:hypothetical protein